MGQHLKASQEGGSCPGHLASPGARDPWSPNFRHEGEWRSQTLNALVWG